MTVRMRVVAAFATVALPAVVLLFVLSRDAQREGQLEATYASVLGRMDSGARERCEANPARFSHVLGRRARGRRGPLLLGPAVYAYDAAFHGAAGAPAIPAGLREALEDGETIAREARGTREAIAMKMPWDDGPCAVLYTLRPAPSEQRAWRSLVTPLAVLLLALAVALVALGPPLGRLRDLAEAVKTDPADAELARIGKTHDEIGELARALAAATVSLREKVVMLEARDRALSEYVAGTTHDLAIPITVLANHLAEAEEHARAGAPIDPAMLSSALTECHYATQLLSNLATATKLEDAAPSVRARVDLALLIERVYLRHRSLARARETELAFSVPEERLTVIGDETLLERAIGNLVHNAIRHADRRGGSGHVALVLERDHDRFRVTVEDDGARVDDALLARLAAGDVDSPSRTRGRGLGLSIVRRVAEEHGLTLAFTRGESGLRVTLGGPIA